MEITSYIINLKTSEDRKAYMTQIMKPFPFLKPVFVEAVNGRLLSTDEIRSLFNVGEGYRRYGREIRQTEVGCTLSHKKCAQALLESSEKVALVLEDDLVWQSEQLKDIIGAVHKYMDVDDPIICLLSGDYLFTRLSDFSCGYRIAAVWDAVCAQAYLINRSAAEKLLSMDNWHLADDWYEIRHAGIKLIALYHHVADQNRADIKSVIAEKYAGINRKKMATRFMIRSCWRSLVDKLLVWCGHFEEKNFKW